MDDRTKSASPDVHEEPSHLADVSGFEFSAEDRAAYVHAEELKDFIFEGGVLPAVLRRRLLFALEHSDVVRASTGVRSSIVPDRMLRDGFSSEGRAMIHADILLRLLQRGYPIPADARKYLIDSLRRMERREGGEAPRSSEGLGVETVRVDWKGYPVKDVSSEHPVPFLLSKRKLR